VEVEMKIRGLMMDPATNMPIVVLKDVGSDTVLPIWVGVYEANAIALEIEKVTTPRPMTPLRSMSTMSARSAGGRRSRLAASTVPENPAPTITKVFRMLWKFYQANMAIRPCGGVILPLTFGPIRGQIAYS